MIKVFPNHKKIIESFILFDPMASTRRKKYGGQQSNGKRTKKETKPI